MFVFYRTGEYFVSILLLLIRLYLCLLTLIFSVFYNKIAINKNKLLFVCYFGANIITELLLVINGEVDKEAESSA